MLRRQAHQGGGVVGGKDAGQHARRIARGQLPGVARALLGGQLGAVAQRHGHALRVHEQVVLGQKAGEQHAVPGAVGDLLHQGGHTRGLVAGAALAGYGAQRPAQGSLPLVHGGVGLRALHGQRLQGRLGSPLGRIASGDHRPLELVAQVSGQRGHGANSSGVGSQDHRVPGVEMHEDLGLERRHVGLRLLGGVQRRLLGVHAHRFGLQQFGRPSRSTLNHIPIQLRALNEQALHLGHIVPISRSVANVPM